MNNFDKALEFTLSFEGGKVDNPHDPGGRTNQGITQRSYDAWCKAKGLASTSVYNLTHSQVSAFYRSLWNSFGCPQLPSGVDVMAFDMAVNMGFGRVKPWLIGSSHLPPKARISYLDGKRMLFWRHLRIFRVFGGGWTRRETACLKFAMSLAP